MIGKEVGGNVEVSVHGFGIKAHFLAADSITMPQIWIYYYYYYHHYCCCYYYYFKSLQLPWIDKILRQFPFLKKHLKPLLQPSFHTVNHPVH